LLVGATGMVGTQVAALVPPAMLTILARRATHIADGATLMVASSDEWPSLIAAARPDVVVSTLGTTIRQAGSQAAFRAVDHDLVLSVARAAKDAGVRHFIAVSSVGASARASNFYLRTKGEVEAALGALDFDRLDIVRPGLLTGARSGPTRVGEALAMLAAPATDVLLHGALRRYRSVPAATVATAIAALAEAGGSGRHVHEHDAIVQLAD
jgi:uncharacterized protein YbjT (DUF2867 family)